jgi:hypothetical protein
MKEYGRVRFVEDNFKGGEDHRWDVLSGVVGKSEGERFACQVPDFSRVVFTAVEQVFHGFNFFTSIAESIESSSGLESFILRPTALKLT